jgi:ferredoxin
MTHIITSLCLRDSGCVDVCPVECISPGNPAGLWPTYFIDPGACIDCGACVPECPFNAIFPQDEVPSAYKAKGGEFINQPGLSGHYEGVNHKGKVVALETSRQLTKGEVVDLTPSIQLQYDYAK